MKSLVSYVVRKNNAFYRWNFKWNNICHSDAIILYLNVNHDELNAKDSKNHGGTCALIAHKLDMKWL